MTEAHPEIDVQRLCRLAGISRASFYRHRDESDPDAADHALADAIQHICLKHKYYGYRRVTATLRRQGHIVNAKRVLRLMREDNLLAQRRKPFIVPPKGKPEDIIIVPNLVRGLVPSGPDQIWVADITMCIWHAPLPISPSSLTPSRDAQWVGPWRKGLARHLP